MHRIKIMAGCLLCCCTLALQASPRKMTVEELFRLVEEHSLLLQSRKTGEEAARQQVAGARRQLLPDINGSVSVSYLGNALLTDRDFGNAHGLSSSHVGNSFSLEARQQVYSGGALSAGVRLAELRQELSGVDAEQARQQERFMALGQYLDLYKLGNRIQVVEKNMELTRQLLDDIRARHEQGMALKNDITRYELQLQSLDLELTKLRNRYAIVNHDLCNTLGLGRDVQVEPDDALIGQAYGKDAEGVWQEAAAENALQAKAADVSLRIAGQEERLARSEMRPKVSLFAADNLNGPITYELPPVNKNINVWCVGVALTYPISSLYKGSAKVRQKELLTRQRQEEQALVAEQIDNAMHEAHTDYMQAYVELQTQQKSVELAGQNYRVVSDRYLNQLALITDMIDASNLKLNAELLEVDALIRIAYAYYRMKYVAGTL